MKRSQLIPIIAALLTLSAIAVVYLFWEEQTPTQLEHPIVQSAPTEEDKSIHLSERARKLAQVEVAPVIRKFVPAVIRLYGRIDYDETKLAHITAWVPGRIEKLYVNFTGMEVKKGEPMADYYSPELIVAQQELLQSLKSSRELKNSATSFAKDQSERNLASSRVKLRLFGISPEQIEKIEKSGRVEEVLQVKAPTSGVVIHKNALEGEYVKEGTEIFTIADLNEVWVQLEAYESDLSALKLGEKVSFTTDALPGETFSGTIHFIAPFLNEKTRTASIRLNAENQDGKLKPGMYVTGIVKSQISAGEKRPPLIIPASAPLITGKRAIVYVQAPDDPSRYQLREVILGPKVGGYYIVSSGLKEGELVVVHGNFKIDSAAQIRAKPSMMSPEGGVSPTKGHRH